MEGKLTTISKVIMACAQLHNFIIETDESFGEYDVHGDDCDDEEEIIHMEGTSSGMAYRPVMLLPGEEIEVVQGNSEIRKALVEEISSQCIQRPNYSILRNQIIEEVDEEYHHPQKVIHV